MNTEGNVHYRQYSCIDEQGFWDMVATCAYYKFAGRGFKDGYALQDWLEAEEEVSKRCFYWFQDIE
jgi:hypothetical protein